MEKVIKRDNLIALQFSVLGTCGLELLFYICDHSFIGGIVFLPVVYVTFLAYKSVIKEKRNTGMSILAGMLTLIYAGLFCFGMEFDILENASLSGWSACAVLLIFVELFPFIWLLLRWLDDFQVVSRDNKTVLKRCFLALLVAWGGHF